MKEEEFLIAHSEDAEIRYYEGGAFVVDNYDTEVSFEETEIIKGVFTKEKDGSIICVPFKSSRANRGNDQKILSTGPATFRRTPHAQNVKLTIILPREAATEKNFRIQFDEVFRAIREAKIDLTAE